MSRFFKLLPLVGVLLASCGQGFDVDVQEELLEMALMDQEVRERADELLDGPSGSKEELKAAVEEEDRVDSRNFTKLETIVAEYGWPGRQLVGPEAASAALIVLQHADVEDQRRYLPLLQAAAAEGEIAAADVARLEDGIRQGEGKSQIYGTRVVSDIRGQPELYRIEDPKNLDERREAVGLPPIAEQLKQLKVEFGMPVGRGNLPPE